MALSKGVSKMVGLGTEAYAHHKDKKEKAASTQDGHIDASNSASAPNHSLSPSYPTTEGHDAHSDAELSSDEDEADWIRDETQAQLTPASDAKKPDYEGHDVNKLVADFVKRHPAPPQPATSICPLPNPVIIPQQRPGTKFRGFVPAYAPSLAPCGVDEQAFMEIHEGMHKSVSEQGWFHVSNIAVGLSVLSYTAAVAPSLVVHASAMVVHLSVEAGRRMWMSKKTNSYLDQMNEQYFQPRGLFALIMTYKPGSNETHELVDARTNTSNAVAGRAEHERSSYKTSSGKTFGEDQLPLAAPLVFPKLENASDEEKKNAFKRATSFMAAYSDKQAKAEFYGKAPDSQLNVEPKPEFSSIFADPNHPINQGGLISMLRGHRGPERKGLIQAHREARGKPTLSSRREARHEKKSEMGAGKTAAEGPTGLLGSVKRKMKEDVLYLMVVNMPSDEELKAAAEMMEMAKKAGYKV